MTKDVLAQYLVNLHTLMGAQYSDPSSLPSQMLKNEYEQGWRDLKEMVKKEHDDAARKSTDGSVGS